MKKPSKKTAPRKPSVRSGIKTGKGPEPEEKVHPLEISKILIPIDFSPCSEKALQYSVPFAARFGSQIVLLHVVETYPADPFIGGEVIAEENARRSELARRELDLWAERLKNLNCKNVTCLLRVGKPFAEINHAARETGADLILLSSHGYTGLKHIYLGSTAERVVRHSNCPVLVVRN